MSHSAFTDLLKKYQSGTVTEKERRIIEQWYALIDESPRTLSPEEWEMMEKRLWQKMGKEMGNPGSLPRERSSVRWYHHPLLKSAAIIAFLAGFAFLLFLYNGQIQNKQAAGKNRETGMRSVQNPDTKDAGITLEDGSTVLLRPGSVLTYPEHFNENSREVHLTGEAFFVISKNQGRPFLVNTGKITTKVLGTSFRVKANEDGSEVEVSVKTGKVSVYEKAPADGDQAGNSSHGVILTPNQQVTFNGENGRFVTGLVKNPEVLPETDFLRHKLFDYNDTELSKIISDLKKAYHIDIELEKKALGECPLTANLREKDLFVQLDLICAAIQGGYSVNGTKILIDGKGCD